MVIAWLLATPGAPPAAAGGLPAWTAGAAPGRLGSASCIACHAAEGEAWRGSLHHRANAEFDPKAARTAEMFAGQTVRTHAAGYEFTGAAAGAPVFRERRRDGGVLAHRPAMTLGHGTLQQLLVESRPGNFQATEVVWDPARREWFDVLGGAERNPGEWGHWTGQGMNWNSNCAACHMTGFAKNHDAAADRFRSAWIEQGVGCVQCHGAMTGHEAGGAAAKPGENLSREPARMIQTCASCHARAEELTAAFPPGARFDDHYRLQLVDGGRVYHPDGQILDETFEWGSFVHSRMSAAGVTCLDCHHAHSGKLRFPADDNALCLQCHAAGNTRGAPAIEPTAHSFHGADSAGNRCVACHMAETTYLQRDPRRDHGFVIPDPTLKRELGVPDACSRCHTDRSTDELVAAWERRHGNDAKHAPRRDRTRAMARAFKDDVAAVAELLRAVAQERVPAWRASLLAQADRLAPGRADVVAAAQSARDDADPLVRTVAVRAASRSAEAESAVRAALRDPVRVVRLEAAAALSASLDAADPARVEYAASLEVAIERPAAKLRRGQDRFARGERAAGLSDVRAALALDPLSPDFPEALGFMLNATGEPRAAAEQFEHAARLAPENAAPAYFAALAWAAHGDSAKAEAQFRETVRRAPGHARAWYNLGLLLSRTGRAAESLAALATAEACDATDADIPYAAATIHAQAGRRAEALACARRALAANPRHASAQRLAAALER